MPVINLPTYPLNVNASPIAAPFRVAAYTSGVPTSPTPAPWVTRPLVARPAANIVTPWPTS